MIIEQLYDALLEAGASEAKAREAAKVVTETLATRDFLDARLAQLEARINRAMLLQAGVIVTLVVTLVKLL